jgi:hypothetical protein
MAKPKVKTADAPLLEGAEGGIVVTTAAPAQAVAPVKAAAATVRKIEPQQPPNLLAVVAAAAADPRVDVAKMKELLAMQREIERADQERAFNRAMLAAQSDMPKIVKDRKNDHTKSRYATLERVSIDVDPVARKHGFSMSFGTEDSPLPGHYRIVCDLAHEGGHTRRYQIDLESDSAGAKGTSNKTPVQGVGSTASYGRRYLKVMMFDLVIVNEDRDGSPKNDSITEQQVKNLRDYIDQVEAIEAKVCEVMGIETLEDLPAKNYRQIVDRLRAFGKNTTKKELIERVAK